MVNSEDVETMQHNDDHKEEKEDDAKNTAKLRGKKRKRLASDSSTDTEVVLPENTLEIEKNLQASAIKNNLDDVSVKKILKKVVTNDHVLALVKLREQEEDSSTEENMQPKLTRAKAKELKKPPWNLELTPIKHIPVKTRAEVKALIAQELPDDEDDEEYQPKDDDVPSDDDHVSESCSDLDSQPRTPATPLNQRKLSPKVVTDGPFKVPQDTVTPVCRKLELEEEATIALRTRSKLSLSATPIEHIESSFVPPDDLPMPAVDDLWNEFLKECLNPVSSSRHEEDDETDPEYNVAADPDANEEDEEALENSIIKISKKELNDLVTELFNVLPDSCEDQLTADGTMISKDNNSSFNVTVNTTWEGKQEPVSDEEQNKSNMASRIVFENRDIMSRFSIGKTEPEDNDDDEQGNMQIVEISQLNTEEPTSTSSPTKSTSTVATASKVNIATTMSSSGPTLILRPVTRSRSKAIQISVEEESVGCEGVKNKEPSEDSGESQQLPPLLRTLARREIHTITVPVDTPAFKPEQLLILQQQLRQHIQLCTSNFMQLYVHPVHWKYGPAYKEYLVSLNKVLESNPKSVVGVCNLKPALELVVGWEETVSEDTPQNAKMIEFVQNQVERCRKRYAQNAILVGDFPELFKEVVANSCVFLYPSLLPPLPYRADSVQRRFCYLHSEDSLIVLGLDQFGWYIENNPDLFKWHTNPNPRHRWGLSTACGLLHKHMLPWISHRALLCHIRIQKRSGDKHNPIWKYFYESKIDPVKHKLLPFNPKMTLYEQPEHEMPKLWIRYLAQSSKRFQKHVYKKRKSTVVCAEGVEITLGKDVVIPAVNPLPIDYTKEIPRNSINLLPKNKDYVDKIDLHIGKETNVSTNTSVLVASNIFTYIKTSEGSKLVPLEIQTTTVDSISAPICTPAELSNVLERNNGKKKEKGNKNQINLYEMIKKTLADREKAVEIKNEEEIRKITPEHCKCCILLRKLYKKRQTYITDYFRPRNNSKENITCGCKNIKYPRITNKLKMLVRNYQENSATVYQDLLASINNCIQTPSNTTDKLKDEKHSNDLDMKEMASVLMYQLKVTHRVNIIRDTNIKRRLQTIFKRFDLQKDNPLDMAEKLSDIFGIDLFDLYKEFLAFLTPEQADKINHFKDYFIRNCVEELVVKVKKEVSNNVDQYKILTCIRDSVDIAVCNICGPCGMCCALLRCTANYPTLMSHIFSLFPHRRKGASDNCIKCKSKFSEEDNIPLSQFSTRVPESQPADHETLPADDKDAAMDYEADHSSDNGEADEADEADEDEQTKDTPADKDPSEAQDTIPPVTTEDSKPSLELLDYKIEINEHSESTAMSEDETVKSEMPEWKREEDKLILEVIKEYLYPDERKETTIIDIIEEKDVIKLLSESLTHKSIEEIRQRILYLLRILLVSETDK